MAAKAAVGGHLLIGLLLLLRLRNDLRQYRSDLLQHIADVLRRQLTLSAPVRSAELASAPLTESTLTKCALTEWTLTEALLSLLVLGLLQQLRQILQLLRVMLLRILKSVLLRGIGMKHDDLPLRVRPPLPHPWRGGQRTGGKWSKDEGHARRGSRICALPLQRRFRGLPAKPQRCVALAAYFNSRGVTKRVSLPAPLPVCDQ